MALITLNDIIDYVRKKSNEDSDAFFTDEILKTYINSVISSICEECLVYEKLAKLLVEESTDGIYLPEDFIEIIEFYVNNKRYTQISFGDLKNYVGENATKKSAYLYYIRNNKLIVLNTDTGVIQDYSIHKDDELTLYYYAYYPKLENPTDAIQGEFRRQSMIDLIANGVIQKMLEQDELYNEAGYYAQQYEVGKMRLKKRNKFRSIGQVNWKCVNPNNPKFYRKYEDN